MLALTFFTVLAGLVSFCTAGYVLEDDYSGDAFFGMFDFFTGGDPTHGYVTYVDQGTAQSSGLINTNNGAAYMGVDHTNVATGSGRASVRLTSKKTYTHALIILDLAHMPGSICGTWPAFWTVGPNWPNSGEIDIIEGVNSQTSNAMTLHTGPGCAITHTGVFSGSINTPNCNVAAVGQATNAGCSITTTNSATYGNGFNAQGGGVYAMEWSSEAISIWSFAKGAVPADIGSGNPDPSGWGSPVASFAGGCDIDSIFSNHQIVFDTTFCGDWAGAVWTTDPVCSSKAATCNAFVQNNPGAFADAYWSVNSLKVYQANGNVKVPAPAAATSAPGAASVSVPTPASISNAAVPSVAASSAGVPVQSNAFTQGNGNHHTHSQLGANVVNTNVAIAAASETAASSEPATPTAAGAKVALVPTDTASSSTTIDATTPTTSAAAGVFAAGAQSTISTSAAAVAASNTPSAQNPAEPATVPSPPSPAIASTETSSTPTTASESSSSTASSDSTNQDNSHWTGKGAWGGHSAYPSKSWPHALDSFDFPSSGAVQTAGVPVPQKEKRSDPDSPPPPSSPTEQGETVTEGAEEAGLEVNQTGELKARTPNSHHHRHNHLLKHINRAAAAGQEQGRSHARNHWFRM